MTASPVKKFQYFFIACLLIKLVFVLIAFWESISNPLDDAFVSGTLLNYKHGFQRRSLAGTVFLFFSDNRFFLTVCIKAVFLSCTLVLFVLFLKPFRKSTLPVVALALLLFIDCPFAFSFYKVWWFSKEFLFFPLIAVFLLAFRLKQNVLRLLIFNGIVVTGLLIHETFVFLVLPFLLAYCVLNGWKIRDLFTLPMTACLVLFIIKMFSIPAEPAISQYITDARQMGFVISDQFMAPLNYMRASLPALFEFGFRNFLEPINWIYAILYLVQIGCLYLIYDLFANQMMIENGRSLLYALLFIQLGALPLYPLAVDYGRWSSFTFIVSLLLIVRRVRVFPHDLSSSRNPLRYRILLTVMPVFFVLIRIPLYTVSRQNSLLNYLREFTIYTKVVHYWQ